VSRVTFPLLVRSNTREKPAQCDVGRAKHFFLVKAGLSITRDESAWLPKRPAE